MPLDASGSSDPDGDPLTYAWDLDNDGTHETTGLTTEVTFYDDGIYTVGLLVTDTTGASRTDSADVFFSAIRRSFCFQTMF